MFHPVQCLDVGLKEFGLACHSGRVPGPGREDGVDLQGGQRVVARLAFALAGGLHQQVDEGGEDVALVPADLSAVVGRDTAPPSKRDQADAFGVAAEFVVTADQTENLQVPTLFD